MPSLGVVAVNMSVQSISLFRIVRFLSGARERSVPDGVVGAEADPLGNGAILLLRLRKLLLGAERLLGLYRVSRAGIRTVAGASIQAF